MTTDEAALNGACAKHSERIAVSVCDDCAAPMCERCVVTIPDIGTFCWDCAARRGGLHPQRHKVHQAGASAPEPSYLPLTGTDNQVGIREFEERMADREPHTLISGLTEALEDAGADPEDVVDDDELVQDITHLQDLAAEPEPRSWRHRG